MDSAPLFLVAICVVAVFIWIVLDWKKKGSP
jgi:hypothetical protein